MKKLGFALTAFFALAFAGCEKDEAVKVEFKEPAYGVTVGDVKDMAAEVVVSNSVAEPVWSVSDQAVATISEDGILTALDSGKAVVTVKVEDKTASCTVTVSEIAAESIALNAPEAVCADGSWVKITAEVTPEGYDEENLEWTFVATTETMGFEYERVSASEYNVRFKAYAEGGKVTVTVADSNSDVAAVRDITVTEKIVQAERIALSMPSELTEGDDVWASVTAEVTPEDYDAEHLVWEFEPSSPDLGFRYEKVSATEYKVGFGSFVPDGTVTVTVSDELSEVFNMGRIKVLEKPVEGVLSLSLSPSSLALNVGDEPVELQVSYEPADYDLTLLEWTSSDEKVVTVAEGTVAVVGEGEAEVKVKDTVSGKEAVCKVKVTTPVKEAEVSKIVLSRTSLEMRVGEESVQLTATCYDQDGEVVENYAGLEWSAAPMIGESGEIDVVEVSQKGVVTPKNAGTTYIEVWRKDRPSVKAKCDVFVKAAEIKVETVRLSPSEKTVDIAETFTLTATVLPENAENKTIVFSSSDDKVAAVTEDGTVTGVSYGEAVITAVSSNGVKGECKVTVKSSRIPVESVTLNATSREMDLNETFELKATVLPENATDRTLTWTSSDASVAEVSETGLVKSLKEGKTTITATADGVSAKCEITVKVMVVEATGIEITGDKTEANPGETVELSVRFLPEGAASSTVNWTTSDAAVATVDDGVVTVNAFKGASSADDCIVTITATSGSLQDTYDIKVLPVPVAEVRLDQTRMELEVASESLLKATVGPADASCPEVTWTSDNPEVAEVDQEGKVTAKKTGTANVTASADGKSAVCVVTVIPVQFKIALSLPEGSDVGTNGLQQDKTVRLNATYSKVSDGQEYKPIVTQWKSSDETVATVDSEGNVTAVIAHLDRSGLANGKKVTITHIADDKEKEFEITVVKAMAERIEIQEPMPEVNGEKMKIWHGSSFEFKAKIYPEKAEQTVKWLCGAGSAIGYDSGVFYANSVGTVDIIAYAYDDEYGPTGVKQQIYIEVVPVPATGMTMSSTSLSMTTGTQAVLTADITPSNASYKNVTWTSSDEAVVSVNESGVVTALSAGRAQITATQAENNISCTCEIVVSDPVVEYHVGDYYYSTGKVSPRADEDEAVYGKVIGVIFSLNNPAQMGDESLAKDCPDCVNGFVVGLTEYESKMVNDMQWGRKDCSNWFSSNGYTTIGDTEKIVGYSNTKAYEAINAANVQSYGHTIYWDLFASDPGLVSHRRDFVSPEGASSWYVPSYAEMKLLKENQSAINSAIAAAGGTQIAKDEYWCSTQMDLYGGAYYCFSMNNNGWATYIGSFGNSKPFRVVLAF